MPPVNTPETKKVELPRIELRGSLVPETADMEAGTVQVLFLPVGAKALRFRFFDEPFELSFSMEPGAADLTRMESGTMAVLLDHENRLVSQGGVVLGGSVDPERGGLAELRLTKREDLAWFREGVLSGEFQNVSMGVRIKRLREITEADDALDQFLAISWEPLEISFTPVQALVGASALSEDHVPSPGETLYTCQIEALTMPPKNDEPKGQPKDNTTTAPTEEQLAAERQRGAELERQRTSAITTCARALNLSEDPLFEKLLADPKTDLEAAQKQLIARREELDAQEPSDSGHRGTDTLSVEREEGTKKMLAMQNVLEVNANLTDAKGEPVRYTDEGAELRGMTLMEMGRECLRLAGRKAPAGKKELAGAALRMSKQSGVLWDARMATSLSAFETQLASHSTSDFPLLLANTHSKVLRKAYDETRQTFRAWASRGTLPDFKTMDLVALGEFSNLLEVPEGAEFKTGTMGESKETIQLVTYGRTAVMTRQMMINDDLRGFLRIGRNFGSAASRLESDVVYNLVTSNPNLSDSTAVFEASSHKNLATGLTSLNVAALNALRELARAQTGLDRTAGSTSFLNLDLVHLLVPEGLELEAQQLTSSIQAQTVGNVNPFAGSFRTVQAEPRLGADSQTKFYMFADPSQIDTLLFAYLQGEEGPVLESEIDFEKDGMAQKVRLDFGAAWEEFRGGYRGDL